MQTCWMRIDFLSVCQNIDMNDFLNLDIIACLWPESFGDTWKKLVWFDI